MSSFLFADTIQFCKRNISEIINSDFMFVKLVKANVGLRGSRTYFLLSFSVAVVRSSGGGGNSRQ